MVCYRMALGDVMLRCHVAFQCMHGFDVARAAQCDIHVEMADACLTCRRMPALASLKRAMVEGP